VRAVEVKYTETVTRTATYIVPDDHPNRWLGFEDVDDAITDQVMHLVANSKPIGTSDATTGITIHSISPA
jgi:hypothetical protein